MCLLGPRSTKLRLLLQSDCLQIGSLMQSTGGKGIRLWLHSLSCGARSRWGHSWSSCYLSLKNSFPCNSTWLVLFIKRHSQFVFHERAIIIYCQKSTWVVPACSPDLHLTQGQPLKPGFCSLVSFLHSPPFFLMLILVLVYSVTSH